MTTVDELRDLEGATDRPDDPVYNHPPARRTRRTWSTEDKAFIVEQYDEAPSGTKQTVLARWGIGAGLIGRWRRELGEAEAAVDAELDTANQDTTASERDPSASDALDQEIELHEITTLSIVLDDDDELEILDALGYLGGHGDATGYLVALTNATIAEHTDDDDVRLCIAARRGHRAEHDEATT